LELDLMDFVIFFFSFNTEELSQSTLGLEFQHTLSSAYTTEGY
jgi:hypothetical protein